MVFGSNVLPKRHEVGCFALGEVYNELGVPGWSRSRVSRVLCSVAGPR